MRALAILTFSCLAACSSGFYSSSYSFHGSTGDALVESHGGGLFYVAWYRDGELLGASAAGHPEFPLRHMLEGKQVVDHPDLAAWRLQIEELTRVADAADTSADAMRRAARGCRFDSAVEDAVGRWVGEHPTRAAAMLDGFCDLDVRDEFAERLTRLALMADADDTRLARWARDLIEEDHDEAVLTLVAHSGVGPKTSRSVLHNLDDLSSKRRARVFTTTAKHVANDPECAYLVVEAVDELPSSREVEALLELLDHSSSPELLRQLLRTIDDRRSSHRLELFQRIAPLAMQDSRNHYAIVQAVEDLTSSQRLTAMRGLVEWPEVPHDLVFMLVAAIDELPSHDREEFLVAVLEGSHGAEIDIRRAVRNAAEDDLTSRSRKRILGRLER